MEYAPGGDLVDYMAKRGGRLSEDLARFVYQQILIALEYCHKLVRDHINTCNRSACQRHSCKRLSHFFPVVANTLARTRYVLCRFSCNACIVCDAMPLQAVVDRRIRLENTLIVPLPGQAVPIIKLCDFYQQWVR